MPALDGPHLCGRCRRVRLVRTARSAFHLCGRHEEDPATFAKYPRIPVLRCPGFEPEP